MEESARCFFILTDEISLTKHFECLSEWAIYREVDIILRQEESNVGFQENYGVICGPPRCQHTSTYFAYWSYTDCSGKRTVSTWSRKSTLQTGHILKMQLILGVGLMMSRIWNLDVALIYTTHATLLGRHLAAGGTDLYNNLGNYNLDEEAGKRNVRSVLEIFCSNSVTKN